MSNFDKQLKTAIETYSELSGMTFSEVSKKCTNTESSVYRSVSMIMFMAR